MLLFLYFIIIGLISFRIYNILQTGRVELRNKKVYHKEDKAYWLYLGMFVFFAGLVTVFYFFN